MIKTNSRRILRATTYASSALLLALLTQPASALAQEAVWPSNAEEHPGEIVYSRTVPYGTATRRFAQGEAQTVVPDQSRLIEDSMMLGLEPLSDAEQAAVAAPLNNALKATNRGMDAGLSVLLSSRGSGDFTRSESGGSATGAIVSNGLSVLPSALAAIGKSTGSGQ